MCTDDGSHVTGTNALFLPKMSILMTPEMDSNCPSSDSVRGFLVSNAFRPHCVYLRMCRGEADTNFILQVGMVLKLNKAGFRGSFGWHTTLVKLSERGFLELS